MIKKLIFLYPNFFLDKDFERWGVKYYLERNVNIEIWNILGIINKKAFKENKIYQKENKNIKIIRLQNFENFKNLLISQPKDSIFIAPMNISYENQLIFKELQKQKKIWGPYLTNYYPAKKISFINRSILFLRNRKLLFKKINYLFQKIFDIKRGGNNNMLTPKFLIYSGIHARNNNSFHVSSLSQLISVPSLAYNEFINAKIYKEKNHELENLIKSKYIVYIDENVPNHTDPIYHGYHKKLCEPIIFYSEIIKFFSFLEKKYECKVVVAGYPKSKYDTNNNPYKRKIYYDKTFQLVKNSHLVIQHNSTAVNFSVLNNKNIFFLTSKNYSLHYRLSIEHLADELGKKTIDLSDKDTWDLNQEKNTKKYDGYILNYISAHDRNDNHFSHEIIYDSFNKLLKQYKNIKPSI